MAWRVLALWILPLAGLGCTARSSSTIDLWVVQAGGLVNDARQQRIEQIAKPLVACCHGRNLTIAVFASDQLCAYAWPSGHLFVSRGLVDRLTDAELAAAIAHELGHLLCDGYIQGPVSLCGPGVPSEREIRADAAGLALLHAAGLPMQPMVSMLAKVAASVDSTQSRAAMQQRIQLLSLEIARYSANRR